jgi:hypothetical protein
MLSNDGETDDEVNEGRPGGVEDNSVRRREVISGGERGGLRRAKEMRFQTECGRGVSWRERTMFVTARRKWRP